MESALRKAAVVAADTIVYWIVTAFFCLRMSFTASAQMRLPQLAEEFTHLGFPACFRVELSWAKLLGVVLLSPQAGCHHLLRTTIEPEEASTCGGCRLRWAQLK